MSDHLRKIVILKEALKIARQQIVLLGGDPFTIPPDSRDKIQECILQIIDAALGGPSTVTKRPYTIKELDAAIRWTFNFKPSYDAVMKHSGRVAAHRMAIEHAFMDELSGPKADILRSAMKDLNTAGAYLPSDGVFSKD